MFMFCFTGLLVLTDVQHSIPISLEKSVGCPIFLTFSRFQNKLFAITDKGHFVSVGLLGVSPSATATPVVPAVLDLQLEEGDGYAKAISIPGTDVVSALSFSLIDELINRPISLSILFLPLTQKQQQHEHTCTVSDRHSPRPYHRC